MRKDLTKIEILDRRHPGLADNIRDWFSQGISTRKVLALVRERYPLELSRNPIALFRARVWAPEQELLRQKKIEARAAQEVAREQEVKAALARNVPERAKL